MYKFLPLALVFATNMFSQITVTLASMPVSGDTIRYSNTNPNSIDVTQTGPNYYWNYDTLKSFNQGRYDYLAASLTPYGFYFTGPGKYGMKTADSIGTAPYKFYDVYTFFKKSATYFDAEGIGFKYSGFPLAAFYSDPDEIYSLPMTYLRHDSTTFKFTVSLGTNIYYSQVGYRINDVDGWGVVKTPHDSVDCLRLVSHITEKDSVNYNGIPITFPNNQITYKWVSTVSHAPILEVDGRNAGGNFTPTIARYIDSYINTVGVSEINYAANVTIFPNPAQNFIIIKTDYKNPATVELYDVTGKLLQKMETNHGIALFDIKTVPSQMCSYRIISADAKLLHRGKVLISK